MRNICKKENGITVISLAITVVVILIIASVTINYSLDSIEHSKYMAMYSEIQIIQEKVNLFDSEGKEIVNTNLTNDQKLILESKGVSPDRFENYYYFTNSNLKNVFDIDSVQGEYLISLIDRDVICLGTFKTGTEEVENYRLSDISKEYNVETMPKLSEVAEIGQYVNYDPTSGENATNANTIYTSITGTTTEHGNGARTQEFSAAAYKASNGKWKILDIEENGTITLISDLIYPDSGSTMGTQGFTLSNGRGYLWAEEELNRICAIYGYGNGADSKRTITYYYGGPNDNNGSIISGAIEGQQGRKTILNADNKTIYTGARSLTISDINNICGTTYHENYSSEGYIKTANNAKYYPTLGGVSDNRKKYRTN